MTYQLGIGDVLRSLGLTPCEPHILCDGCGAKHPVVTKRSHGPTRWFVKGKCPPGWSGERQPRKDYCPVCTANRKHEIEEPND